MRRLIDFGEIDAAFDRRLDHNTSAPLAVALSGGGDSIALLHLAARWAKRNGRRLLALTVDHGLQSESPAWTAFAGRAAKAAGADWRSLLWTGDKPRTGRPAAARMARHRLLADAAREAGACVILFGHIADDLAENDLMRRGDAPTLGRLRDWSPSPVWPQGRGVFAFRPLLNLRREALRDWLRDQRLDWLDDPANDDIRYARARARKALASVHSPATPEPTSRDADAGLVRLAQETTATLDGRLIVPRSTLLEINEKAARRYLAIAAICASGRGAPPRSAALARLHQRLADQAQIAVTLAGARIVVKTGEVTFARAFGDMQRERIAPLTVHAGRPSVWDGRYDVRATVDVTVAALSGSAARLTKIDRIRRLETPADFRAALPALFHGDRVSLPRPFGDGPAAVRALAGPRLAAACGLMSHERDISQGAMAHAPQSSYVEALALA